MVPASAASTRKQAGIPATRNCPQAAMVIVVGIFREILPREWSR
jgi:hypothetical protein